jgi:hypothetical protein
LINGTRNPVYILLFVLSLLLILIYSCNGNTNNQAGDEDGGNQNDITQGDIRNYTTTPVFEKPGMFSINPPGGWLAVDMDNYLEAKEFIPDNFIFPYNFYYMQAAFFELNKLPGNNSAMFIIKSEFTIVDNPSVKEYLMEILPDLFQKALSLTVSISDYYEDIPIAGKSAIGISGAVPIKNNMYTINVFFLSVEEQGSLIFVMLKPLLRRESEEKIFDFIHSIQLQ